MHLIVGLGNPGKKYVLTRHNVGFMLVDALNQNYGDSSYKSQHKAEVAKIRIGSQQLLIAKPQTYMNLSGESVQALIKYYDVPLEKLLVVHDEVDLPFGRLRIQNDRGHAGHNGIRNIHQLLGTKQYARLKIGVSRPANPKQEVADYLLSSFSKQELDELPEILSLAMEATEVFVDKGWKEAANRYNQKNNE